MSENLKRAQNKFWALPMTSPHPYDYEAMVRALDELLAPLRLAHAKARHINHPDLNSTVLGLDDAVSEVKFLRDEYKEKLNPTKCLGNFANAPGRTKEGVW